MKIYLTGIPGSGSSEILASLTKFAAERDHSVDVVSIAAKTFDFARLCGYKIHPENIVEVIPGVQELVRGGGFAQGLLDVQTSTAELTIVDSHACLNYNGLIIPMEDEKYLERLNPDVFITIIDAEERILSRLSERDMWKDKKITISDIVNWQLDEVNFTSMHARYARKPHYVFSFDQALDLIYKTAFHPEMELVYASYAMTNATPELESRRNKFLDRLQKYFAAVDPRSIPQVIDPHKAEDPEDALRFRSTVLCDLKWWVEQSRRVIAFNPSRTYSSGMNSEQVYAKAYTIPVWMVTPEHSPFTSYFVAHKRFDDEKEFFDYLESQGYREIDIYKKPSKK